MKLITILVLLLHWLPSSHTMADSCMDQSRSYYTDDEKKIWEKFKNEFSILGNAKKKIKELFGNTEIPYAIKEDMEKYLCACAIYKRNYKNFDRSFEEILRTTVTEPAILGVNIPYFVFDYAHKFPAVICKLGTNELIIAKGPKMQSLEKPVYNIYVATSNNQNYFDFQGTIDNVNVEIK